MNGHAVPVVSILETGGMKWKFPLIRSHLLECVGRSRWKDSASPNDHNSRKHALVCMCTQALF